MKKQPLNPTNKDIYNLLTLTYEKVNKLENELHEFKEEMYDFRTETRMNLVSINYRLDQIEEKISVIPQMQEDINVLKDQYAGINTFINSELVIIQHRLTEHEKVLRKI